MPDMSVVVIGTNQNFRKEVIEASYEGYVLLDFWAPWCVPCKMLVPVVERIAIDFQSILKVVKINSEQEIGLCRQLGVKTVPMLLLVKDGNPVGFLSEGLSESKLRDFLKHHIL